MTVLLFSKAENSVKISAFTCQARIEALSISRILDGRPLEYHPQKDSASIVYIADFDNMYHRNKLCRQESYFKKYIFVQNVWRKKYKLSCGSSNEND